MDALLPLALSVAKLAGAASIALLVASVVALLPYAVHSSRPKHFPPGPPTVPVLGNLHLIPPQRSYLTFFELGKKYGPIVGLKFATANVIILNSYKDVEELLERRGSIYSSRPPNYIAQELLYQGDLHMLMAPYGATWRAQRRASNLLLAPRTVEQRHLPRLEGPVTACVAALLRKPASYYELLHHLAASIMFATVYGFRAGSVPVGDARIQALFDTQRRMKNLLEPGAAPPVDALPFLRYLPEAVAPWKRAARQLRADIRDLYVVEYDAAQERLRRGDADAAGCFVDVLQQEREKLQLDEEHLAYMAGAMLEAGADTTASQLQSFVLGCLQNPAALRRAQEEVDTVCPLADGPPRLRHLDRLAYVKACVAEVLRWRPVGPAGAPHMLTQTDTYKDYVLPAGTIVFANAWGLHHDEAEFAEPDLFNPDRWLDGNAYGTKNPAADEELGPHDRKPNYAFGAGRRICGGQKLAESTLALAIAKIVWALDISRTTEMEDTPVDTSPVTAYTAGFAVAPVKFPVRIAARSPAHADRVFVDLETLSA